jgi:pimeloyl-ACP methyl ester carboxylesterase
MFDLLKKLKYGARVFLSRKGGQEETIDLHGRPTVMRHGGDGPPFVYLHSTLGESLRWLPFHNAWARDFTVYSPLHPGFGASGGLDQINTIEDMAFHYVELFDALGLEQVILGGVSLGGWIAAEFAVRWPERVKCLWLSGAPGMWVEEEPLPDLFRLLRKPDALRELLFHDPKGYMAEMLMGGEPDEERILQAYQSMTLLARLIWERPYNPRLPARLHRIQCPTLLLWGDDDRLVPPSYGEAYKKYLPQAEFKLIPQCGHLVMFEKEKEFVEAVTRFVKGK